MRVGRGSEKKDQPRGRAGAVTLKPPENARKAKFYRRIDRWINRAGCVHATKNGKFVESMKK